MHSRYLTLRKAIPPKEGKEKAKSISRLRKNKLFLCDICKVVWEQVVCTGHVEAHTEHYPVLPKLGKPIKTCPDCGGINETT
jgi:hypothetical protein